MFAVVARVWAPGLNLLDLHGFPIMRHPLQVRSVLAHLLGSLLFGFACAAQSTIAEQVAAAKKQFDAGESEAAIAKVRAALADAPDAPELHAALALFLSQTGELKEALRAANAAIRLDRQNVEAYLERAFIHSVEDRQLLAQADFARALKLAPGNARAWGMRAEHWMRNEQHEKALADYAEGIRVDPSYPMAFLSRAQSLRVLGDFDGSLRDFRAAIERLPDRIALLEDAAEMASQSGDRNLAVELLSKALVAEPNRSTSLHRRAVLHWSAGDLEAAAADLRRVIDVGGESAVLGIAHQELGAVALLRGAHEEAQREFAAARQASPQIDGWSRLMEWAAMVEKDPAAAAAVLPPATDGDGLMRTVAALLRDGRGDSAALPTSGWKPADACALLFFSGWRALAAGRRVEAEQKFLRCVNSGGDGVQWSVAASILARWHPDRLPAGYGCEVAVGDGGDRLVVEAVDPLGAAAAQGLQVGDVITRIGLQTPSAAVWQALPGFLHPGRVARLTLLRDERPTVVWLRSGYLPTDEQRSFAAASAAPPVSVPRAKEFFATTPEGWQVGETTGVPFEAGLEYRTGTRTGIRVARIGGELVTVLGVWRRMLGCEPLDAEAIAALPRVPFLGADAILVEFTGDYVGLADGSAKIPGARMLLVVHSDATGLVYARCLGPDAEVKAARAAFLTFCASVVRVP